MSRESGAKGEGNEKRPVRFPRARTLWTAAARYKLASFSGAIRGDIIALDMSKEGDRFTRVAKKRTKRGLRRLKKRAHEQVSSFKKRTLFH